MKPFTVLLTGCSTFAYEIVQCLKSNEDGIPVRVVGVDCDTRNLLRKDVDVPLVVGRVNEPNYIDSLIEICDKQGVDIVIPYLTQELELMASNVEKFSSHGVKVSVSPIETLKIANDKIVMYSMFSKYMPMQEVVTDTSDVVPFADKLQSLGKNMCCKLPNKSGGQGFAIIDYDKVNDISLLGRTGGKIYLSLTQLCSMIDNANQPIILQEHCKGYDYSVCILADHGKVLDKVGYIGYSINSGAIMKGEIVKHEIAYKITEEICNILCLDGNICVDFIVDGDNATLLEVNPRVNASIGFCAQANVNLLYQRCRQLLGEDVVVHEPKYGLKMNKYYVADYYV